MQTSVINLRVEPEIKKRAQKVARELGLNLSSVIEGFLKNLIRTKTIHFSLRKEEPSEYMIQALKEVEREKEEGWVSPSFDNVDSAIAWLHNPKAKYANQIRKKV